ncbi:MAG: alanine racemase [Sulfuricurvum sp.]|uniref:alanine racemase n=1 Tax=Sulfuricurvum sp. TaxID=2025608 RepID=UPI0026276C42|nr:alanine racemase [Sulfuricurvum sp.]MDD2828584.1 alanine racemase [Sulfuricurvum sp.]MDD4948261.1 alanine racemase [Sulfuricurvum sp.]
MGTIKLSREALEHNIDIIAHQVGGKDKIAVVLKDNAYGHGAIMIAEAVSNYGINQAVVRLEREADEISEFFENILILGDQPHTPKANFSYVINSLEEIEHFPKGCRVELKLDTGMHRNGVALGEIEEAFLQMSERGLNCIGVMSHLRASDTLSSEWFWQRRNFDDVKDKVLKLGEKYGWKLRFHLSNSGGIFRSSSCSDDMVRAGIALYGCLEMERTLPQPNLKSVLSLWGNRVATRILKKGERVGYNGIYEALEDEVVSTYDLGYANGLDRLASNRYSTPEGIALRGRISMDNAIFSSDKDELLIFDNANDYAKVVGTIGYEILACLDKDLKREWI